MSYLYNGNSDTWKNIFTLKSTQGPDSISRWCLTSVGNPIVEIRRSYDRLISTMGFPILVRWHRYIESGAWCDVYEYGNGCLSWWDVDGFIAPTSTGSLLSGVQLLWLSNNHMLGVSHAAMVNGEKQNSHEYQRPHKNSVHLTHWTLPNMAVVLNMWILNWIQLKDCCSEHVLISCLWVNATW